MSADAQGAPTGPLLLRLTDVKKRFGDNEVLRGISLDIEAGEVAVLIGPSGSGKTTLIRTINALETIDSGTIVVDGMALTHRTADGKVVLADKSVIRRVRRSVGMVFQNFNLFPHMSVLQNVIEAPMYVLGLDRRHAIEAATSLLDTVGLAHKLGAMPHQLSGGQQQGWRSPARWR